MNNESNIGIDNYTMALWNMLDVDELYSIEDILKLIYRIDLLRKQGFEIDEMNKKELYEEVDKILINDVKISDNFVEKEKEWIGNKTKIISGILDSIVGIDNRKQIYENRCQRFFTMQNCIFIVNLFISHNIEDCKRIRKKQYTRVSQEYMDFVYKGVVDLANNEKLKLKLEEVNKIWKSKYYKSVYNFKDDCINFLEIMHEVFDKAIELYVENLESEQEKEYTILDKIRLELTKCKLSISEIDTEFQNEMIWKNEFEK